MSNVFEVKKLVVQYDLQKYPALDSLSLDIKRGSFNVILGPNGSGKSTLLRCLSGLQVWKSGDVSFNGRSRLTDAKDFNADLISVSEEIILPNFKVEDLVRIYRDIWPLFNEASVLRILSYGEISTKSKIQSLSKGQKILCQFALSLGTGVKTVLVDEVTAALDPYVRRRVIDELVEHCQKKQATVIMATNVATEIQLIDSNLILLKAGKLFRSGIYSEVRKEFVKVVMSKSDSRLIGKHWVEVSKKSVEEVYALGLRGEDFGNDESNEAISVEEIFTFLSERGIR